MKLPPRGREYWHPELADLPAGYVAVKAEIGASGWIDFQTVDGDKVVLLAGPAVDVTTWPNPTEAVSVPLGRTAANVLLVGPGSKELLVRSAGVIDVAE